MLPVRFVPEDKLYAYVSNDPVNTIDPSGLVGLGSLARMLGSALGKHPTESSVIGGAVDAMEGVALSQTNIDGLPAPVNQAMDAVQLVDGASTVTLGGYVAGAGGLGPAALGAGLVGGGAYLATDAVMDFLAREYGVSLGSYIYDQLHPNDAGQFCE